MLYSLMKKGYMARQHESSLFWGRGKTLSFRRVIGGAIKLGSGEEMGDMVNLDDAGLLEGRYTPRAVYFMDSDCVEYIKGDEFCVYDRVDEFLTLIFDKTCLNLIGFKLKGFKHVFDKHLRALYKLHDTQFVELVSAIERVFTEIGDQVFADKDERRLSRPTRRRGTSPLVTM